MNKYLIIVEGTVDMERLTKCLENKYTIIPFEDNLCKINKLSDIDIKNTFQPIVRKYKNDFLQKTIDEYDKNNIYLAFHPNDEGEKKSYDFCITFGLSVEIQNRIYFRDYTEVSTKNAILNATKINMNIVKSYQCREIIDHLINIQLRSIIPKCYYSKNVQCCLKRSEINILSYIYKKTEKEKEKEK